MTFSLAAASRSLSRLMPATSPVTYAILTISCLLYGVSLLATIRLNGELASPKGGFDLFGIGGIAGAVLFRLGDSRIDMILRGEPWRLITAIFLHGSLLHIGFNLWVLMDVGPQIEELYGSARYFFIYILTGAAGYILSAVTFHASVGASGALLGLIGVMLAITTRRSGAAMQMLRSQLIRWLIYIGVLGFLMSGIDNMAHLGGLVTGFFLGRVMADREPVTLGERKGAQILGWLTGLAVFGSFAAMLFTFFRGA